jgi:NAD-dependent DNA ligase
MLKEGDTLVIERANDVIPYVRANKSNGDRTIDTFQSQMIPHSCPSCGHDLIQSGVHLKCEEKNCP